MSSIVSLRSLWPRRSPGLPPGQRSLDVFPRFGATPRRPPPAAAGLPQIEVRGDGVAPFTLTAADLLAIPSREQTSDFHCVTTWTHRQVPWTGVPMTGVWRELIAPRCSAQPACVIAIGADGHRAVMTVEDLLLPDVLVATGLYGEPLDPRHGGPLRLVSPAQYGYKSVKHLCALEIRHTRPASSSPVEHLRARVALEERHPKVAGRLLRVPYRLLIPPTIVMAQRAARGGRTG